MSDLQPSNRLKKIIADAEAAHQKGDRSNYSPAFETVDEAIAWLKEKEI